MTDLAAQMLATFPDPALAYAAFDALLARLKVRLARLAGLADLQSQAVQLYPPVSWCQGAGFSQHSKLACGSSDCECGSAGGEPAAVCGRQR